jgi:spore germination protein YaaH
MAHTKKLFLYVSPLILIITGILYLALKYPTTSPLNSTQYLFQSLLHPHLKLKQKIIGFLPNWRLSDSQYTRQDIITEINYFSLNTDTDGNFLEVSGNQEDPGWHGWNSQIVKDLIARTQIAGNKFTLTINAAHNKTIENILDNTTIQQTLLDNIQHQIDSRHLDGINLDFEYLGTPDPKYQTELTNLIQKLRQNNPHLLLSLSIMPAASSGKDLFNFSQLAPLVDQFIIMSYDYYSNNSQTAGPVAPMHGFAQGKYYFDVTTTYENFAKRLPKDKITMGIPYYGWDWAVEDGKAIQSKVLSQSDPNSYTAVISYARMRKDKDLNPQNCQWDTYAEEKWCWYTDKTGTDHQVWLEDDQSISIKFNYAKQQNFQGIAIWNLGYDSSYPDIWNLAAASFKSN